MNALANTARNDAPHWRLLRDGAASGALNMARDETLLDFAARGGPPTLRFYSWQPHCLSLGRLQKTLPDALARALEPRESEQPNLEQRSFEWRASEPRNGKQREGEQREGEPREGEPREGEPREGELREGEPRGVKPRAFEPFDSKRRALERSGFDLDFDVVRRPTGGRAVWHAHEITYSVALALDDLPLDARSVSGAYAWISAGLARGLADLGLPVEAAPGGVRTQGPNCFAASAGCDTLIQGRKLIGAAQFRRDDALLQHGSILLSIDREIWAKRAGGPMNGAISLGELGLDVSGGAVENIIARLCAGFAQAVGAPLERGQWSTAEQNAARALQREKYQSAAWNRTGVI